MSSAGSTGCSSATAMPTGRPRSGWSGHTSQRIVWPLALGYFDETPVLAAWCELRQATRHFRLDRVEALQDLGQRYPRRRQVLLREWRAQEGIAEQ